MYLKSLELSGFKSFAKKARLEFKTPITAIVGPNGSGKSNIAEAFRFVLGEQRMTQMRGKRTEDLIWNGSQKVPKSGRADVKLTFDNLPRPPTPGSEQAERRGRLLDVDFDEVVVERVIHRDSSTDYLLNGSTVRLRDIVELLAGAHIGASGHHIISQGETDRILSVNMRERKEMIEDALGLKIYQYKKEESLHKLEQTEQNIKEVESLRREIKPHLAFLKRQVEKVEKTREMRTELVRLYRLYLAEEEWYITNERKRLTNDRSPRAGELERLSRELAEAKETLAELERAGEKKSDILALEAELSRVRDEKDTHMREVGRLEGEIAAHERVREREDEERVRIAEVKAFAKDVSAELQKGSGTDDSGALQAIIKTVQEMFGSFLSRITEGQTVKEDTTLDTLRDDKQKLDDTLHSLEKREKELSEKYNMLKRAVEADMDSGRDAERRVFAVSTREQEVRTELQKIDAELRTLERFEKELAEEKREADVLAGKEALAYKPVHAVAPRTEQEKRRKELEKLKIRLEDAGGGSGEEIMKEYEEVADRDVFLERELADLVKSAESLKQLIAGLEETLRTEFENGLSKINEGFQELFAIMFGGGIASLKVVQERTRRRSDIEAALMLDEELSDEDEVLEDGVEVVVSLPRKRVKGLQMLSGGERALTSIALLFAMSQVNPPPFLILDETDAALDEANSRRYGDMVERLAKESQIILITHNRETMSRAGVLYGVTMGADGASQLLSVDFEEAVRVAK
ncbi:AAA family ATPase [Candidatus Wolfebacteria bacterium]|nr:AAA family ATPase [Candidatus Wolfebacteria bacterium]